MRVYNVKFTTEIINMMANEELEKISQEEIDSLSGEERMMGFTICAQDYDEANEIAHIMIEGMIGEDSDYELEGVSPVMDESGEQLFISNWGMELENREGDGCPYCRYSEASEEDKMDFKCSKCGTEIHVADGWNEINCCGETCDNIIYRDEVLEINGHWIYRKKIDDSGGDKK